MITHRCLNDKRPGPVPEQETKLVPTICVLIPAFNEEASIAQTIEDYRSVFSKASIVVIDNNSTDRTAEIAGAHLRGPADKLLFEAQQGKGAAIKTGLSRSSADIYIMTDGDGTYAAKDAAHLVDKLLDRRYDMVVGDRISGGAYSRQNRRAGHSWGNSFLSCYVSLMAGERYKDVLSGLRVMSRPFVNSLDVRSDGFQLETELNIVAAYIRASVAESPISYSPRSEGSNSKLRTVRDGIRIAWFALLNWISFYPLQPFGILASIAFAISLGLGIKILSVYLALGAMSYASTAIAAASAGLVGLQAVFTGLMLKISTRGARRQEVARLVEMRRQWNAAIDA